ncbi:hypothetical protein [Kangiella shandongensis]|uniref:hypothetical protein n=1 Tax=Kangiella shandongensis TaxID=2763258 RepID=UPI001CC08C57|nr:hypothetical protein [Kangiella shandongensis]
MTSIRTKLLAITALLVMATTVYAGQGLGHFTKNNATLPLKDQVAFWDDASKTLTIIYTPSRLTASEKEKIKSGEPVFFVLSDKSSPNQQQWQWYPYLLTEIKFNSNKIQTNNIKNIFVMAYGVEEQNHTDNINTSPNDAIKVKKVGFVNEQLKLDFEGSDELFDSQYSWDISI